MIFGKTKIFAGCSILGIGALNFFGPKRTGELAVAVSVPTAIVVIILGLFTVPHLGEAWHNVRPLTGGFWQNWNGFVGIVLAVSGVEAIANATSVMKLDPGSSEGHPSVKKTSTPAILLVVLEVSILTAFLGLGMHALGGLQIDNGDVNAPGHPGVRDYMLRYMAEIFVGGQFGPSFGQVAGWIVTGVFGFLLLSAVNCTGFQSPGSEGNLPCQRLRPNKPKPKVPSHGLNFRKASGLRSFAPCGAPVERSTLRWKSRRI